jgi:hypothetical protein
MRKGYWIFLDPNFVGGPSGISPRTIDHSIVRDGSHPRKNARAGSWVARTVCNKSRMSCTRLFAQVTSSSRRGEMRPVIHSRASLELCRKTALSALWAPGAGFCLLVAECSEGEVTFLLRSL